MESTNGHLELEFDLSKVTARQMKAFFQAAKDNDTDALAAFFTRVVTKCSAGDPAEADTFLDLPYYGDDGFQGVLSRMVEESKKLAKT